MSGGTVSRRFVRGRLVPRGFVPGLILALALSAAGGTAAAQGYSVLQTVFLPPRFYVGDRVELRMRLSTPAGTAVRAPETLPDSSGIEFQDITVNRRGNETEVRIVFYPFYPGTQTLPPIDLGGITLSGVKIHTDSLLDTGQEEWRPPRGQVLLPGTRLYFALFVLGAAVGFTTVAVLAVFGRSRIGRIVNASRERRPYRRLKRVLKKLNAEAGSTDARAFYIVLLDELRSYLSGRLGTECRSATTYELDRRLERYLDERLRASDRSAKPDEKYALREGLLAPFRLGDLVKFGHRPSEPEERLGQLAALKRTVERLEKRLSPRLRPASVRRKRQPAKKEAVHVDD